MWARQTVGQATRVGIDRASFESVARSIGATDSTSADFVKRARAGAEEKAFNDVKVCVGTVKPRCTLPYGTAVVMAVRAKRSADSAVLTIAIKWPFGERMGFVEYDATFAKGALVSVRRGGTGLGGARPPGGGFCRGRRGACAPPPVMWRRRSSARA